MNDWYLFDLALPFASAKRFDVAVEVLEAILDPHDATLDPMLRAYRYRKLGKGSAYAADWFRRKGLPGKKNSWVAYFAFDNREFDLLWLVPDNDEHWLLRAQAAALQGGVSGEYRDRLLAHFRDPKIPAPRHPVKSGAGFAAPEAAPLSPRIARHAQRDGPRSPPMPRSGGVRSRRVDCPQRCRGHLRHEESTREPQTPQKSTRPRIAARTLRATVCGRDCR